MTIKSANYEDLRFSTIFAKNTPVLQPTVSLRNQMDVKLGMKDQTFCHLREIIASQVPVRSDRKQR
jgi:hypothetical protein